MTDNTLFIIRHSGLRLITKAEVLPTFTPQQLQLPRQDEEVITSGFDVENDANAWVESEHYLAQQASKIREVADKSGATEFAYFGLAEIPHAIALGAFLGDTRHARPYDFNRDEGDWRWAEEPLTLELDILMLPQELVTLPGDAVLRVEISALIKDEDVDYYAGKATLANIRIQPKDQSPQVNLIRSGNQARAVREAVRKALAALLTTRPNVGTIHLFVAAPVSVSFLIGQELRLRNNPPFQTYRFKPQSEGPDHRPAILLSVGDVTATVSPPTDAEIARAGEIRTVSWPAALADVQQFASSIKDRADDPKAPWYSTFRHRTILQTAQPFQALPALSQVIHMDDTVDTAVFPGFEYAHVTNRHHQWRLSDPLLIGLSDAVAADEIELKRLIRLFLYHEYIHEHQALTKYTAEQVGRFPNCLERLDYAADLFALLNELEHAMNYELARVKDEKSQKAFLLDVLDLLIRSIWAFEPAGQLDRWAVRRIRRYLNWYWRYVQVEHAPDLKTALTVLSRQPTIELAGLQLQVSGRREYMLLTKKDSSTELSIGVVSEDERLFQLTASVSINIDELLEAFRNRQHGEIKVFFDRVFAQIKMAGGALPEI